MKKIDYTPPRVKYQSPVSITGEGQSWSVQWERTYFEERDEEVLSEFAVLVEEALGVCEAHWPGDLCGDFVYESKNPDFIHIDDFAEKASQCVEAALRDVHERYHDRFGVSTCAECQEIIAKAVDAA